MSVDYATFDAKFDRIKKCLCGSKTCRGKVTPDDYKLPQVQQTYTNHFMPYILNRIAALKQ